MTIQLETKRQISEAIEPSKRWRNKWWTANPGRLADTNFWIDAGEYWSTYVWPSKEIAEQKAIEQGPFPDDNKWLGAFPFPIEGEAP